MPESYLDRARRVLAEHQPAPLHIEGAREAAVLILIYPLAGEERVLLTVRTDTVEHHKGQISFPGGGRDPEDTGLEMTALREAWEEVGVRPEDVEIIGRLDQMLTISNFRVTPFVGILNHAPYDFRPSEIEVAEVLEPPLAFLSDSANRIEEIVERPDGPPYTGVAFLWQGHRVWGATARMLDGFLRLLHEE